MASSIESVADNKARGNYASVNGLRMYYEIHGAGAPLVLLHGGVGGLEMFGPNLAAFAETRKVIAVDLQGHGRTADIDRPLRYEFMADDIAALIEHLGLERADVVGYSLGGGVALQTAIRHPEAVRKLVVISAPAKRDGFYADVLANMAQVGPEVGAHMVHSPLYQLYPGVDWGRLFGKLGELLRQDYDWTEQVAAIAAPMMIMFADADSIRPSHIVEFFALLGGGQRDAGLDGSARPTARLAILPGHSHYDMLSTVEVASAVAPFLGT